MFKIFNRKNKSDKFEDKLKKLEREMEFEYDYYHNIYPNFMNPVHVLKINDKLISGCTSCTISGREGTRMGANYNAELFIISSDEAEFIPDELKNWPNSTFTFYDSYTCKSRTMIILSYSMDTNYTLLCNSKDALGYTLKLKLEDINEEEK